MIKRFYEYQILPFSGNIKLLQGKFIWKLINNWHPSYVKEQFPVAFSKAITSTNCRQTKPYFRTETGKRTLLYQGLKLWKQEIPTLIKNQTKVKNFTKNHQENVPNNIKTR